LTDVQILMKGKHFFHTGDLVHTWGNIDLS